MRDKNIGMDLVIYCWRNIWSHFEQKWLSSIQHACLKDGFHNWLIAEEMSSHFQKQK